MQNRCKLAMVVIHAGARRRAIDLDWLEREYGISDSDRLVLSHEGWQAVADGEGAILQALERKLLIGLHVSAPEFIAVVGHPGGRHHAEPAASGIDEVERVTRRIRSFSLPTTTLGFWTDERGNLQEVLAAAPSPRGWLSINRPSDRARRGSPGFSRSVAGC